MRAIAAMLALALVAGCGGSGDRTGGGTDAGLDPASQQILAGAVPAPAGSDLRAQLLVDLGPPDAFVVAFEAGGDGQAVRRETWSYLEQEAAVELVDGELLDVRPLDPLTGPAIVPSWYDPLAFQPTTTLEEVRAMLADPSALVSTEVPPELGTPLTAYAGDQLIVVFDDTGLVYAETVPLVAEAEP